jgi:hypothetical protein
MIPILLEFALGVAIGSISELLVLKRSEGKRRMKKTSVHSPTRTSTAVQRRQRPVEIPTTKRVIIAKPQAKIELAPAVVPAKIQLTTSAPVLVMSSCPACGLIAPEKLMAEHLLGSPLHRKQSPVTPLLTAPRSTRPRVDVSLQEDSRESMRNLLQMLVPPRAFGRRNAQRTVSPLSQLIQTPDQS